MYKGSWFKPRVLLPAVVVLGAGGLAFNSSRGPVVPVASVAKKPLVQTVVASGRVDVPAKVQIGSVLLGTVESVRADEGQRVKKGTLIIELRDQELHAAVEQARATVQQARIRADQVRQIREPAAAAEVKQAEVSLNQAQTQYERVHELFQKGNATRAEFDNSVSALELARTRYQSALVNAANVTSAGAESRLAQAALGQAEAGLMAADARLNHALISAPSDGVIISRQVEPGDVVQAGKVLMVLARDGDSRLLVPFDEKNLAYLKIGQNAVASADAFPDQKFTATVEWIAPAIDAQRGTVDVRLKVQNPPEFLRADMTVSVEVEVARRVEALVLPNAAVQDATSKEPFVWTILEGKLQKTMVTLGLKGEGLVEVIKGLTEGQQVVAQPSSALREGKRVRTTSEGA